MDIQIFQSFKGDCLLLKSASGHRILCDGGTPPAMRTFVAAELAKLYDDDEVIDLVYVSHIDQDHIGGVLALLEAALEWKIYDLLVEEGDPPTKAPKAPRAPFIKGLWHNAFRDLIKNNTGMIEDVLAASAPALQASHVESLINLGRGYAQIATSIPEALKVARLSKADLLNIPVNQLMENPAQSGKLLMARAEQVPEQLGSLQITTLCPTAKELNDLRKGWDEWLRLPSNRQAAHAIRDRYASALASSSRVPGNPLDLSDWNGVPDYEGVTVPNVASLVLLVEEGDKTLLLTGDSHPDKILAGLKQAGRLKDGFIHLDVLKFPHHGSEHNMTSDFGREVSADHYIFCGNGEHTNPEISVLNKVLAARVGAANQRALAPVAQDRPFIFWFNTTHDRQVNVGAIEHMKKVEEWAEAAMERNPGILTCKFLTDTHQTLTI